MAFSPALIKVRRVRQRAVPDESGRSVAEGFRPSVAIPRRHPRRVEKSFGLLHPFRRLMSVQHRHVLDRGGEKCIPRRARKRRPSPQNPPLLFPAAGVEQAGRFVIKRYTSPVFQPALMPSVYVVRSKNGSVTGALPIIPPCGAAIIPRPIRVRLLPPTH